MELNTWLPPHSLRVSKRAKRMNLKISPEHGLEVIVPVHFNHLELTAFLTQHQVWIQKNYQKLKPFIRDQPEADFPETIALKAIGAQWAVNYVIQNTKKVVIYSELPQQITLVGQKGRNKKMLREALLIWLKQQATQQLIPWLRKLSDQVQLPFAKAQISHARSLWGSCSVTQKITLSSRLLFLPPEWVEYVMLHELCHALHFNHSKQFWDLLKQMNPRCDTLRQKLRYANRYVPLWVLK